MLRQTRQDANAPASHYRAARWVNSDLRYPSFSVKLFFRCTYPLRLALKMALVEIIYGTATIGSELDPLTGAHTPEAAQSALNICRKHGCTHMDSARGHPPQ